MMHARLSPRSERVRALPYPFRGALAISNDVDYCRFEFFEAFMRFCNGSRPTPLGAGLGLEVTSSFFAFSVPERQFSYLAGLAPNAPASPEAARIGEYLAAGWIDANHAYGDFDGFGGFTRAHAERYFEIVERHRGDTRVFINHGDSHNIQCIGPGTAHHEGDRLGRPAYHADLLRRYAPLFVTTSGHSVGHVTDLPQPLDGGERGRALLGRLRGRSRVAHPRNLIEPYSLQDGSRVVAFARLRATGYNAPNLGSLGYQVELIDFPSLYRFDGVVVLYQHWGVLHREAGRCEPATLAAVAARPELLAPLRRLARERDEGRLWIAGVQRLLDYVVMLESTEVEEEPTTGAIRLRCELQPKDPTRFFQGLTLYVDPARPARVLYGEHDLPLARNGPDHLGRYSVTIPMRPLEPIW